MARMGSKTRKAEALAGVPMFATLSKKDRALLAQHVDEVTVPAGRDLAVQGKLGQEMMLIVSGGADVKRNGRRIAQLGPGDVVGELSLIDGKPRSATVTTTDETLMLAMHARDFTAVVNGSPEFQWRILRALAQRVRDVDELFD